MKIIEIIRRTTTPYAVLIPTFNDTSDAGIFILIPRTDKTDFANLEMYADGPVYSIPVPPTQVQEIKQHLRHLNVSFTNRDGVVFEPKHTNFRSHLPKKEEPKPMQTVNVRKATALDKQRITNYKSFKPLWK